MNIKYALLLVFLIASIATSQIEGRSDFVKVKATKKSNNWKDGVQQYDEKCSKSLKYFYGPTFEIAKNVADAIAAYVTKLENLLESESRIISTKTLAILKTFSLMSKVGISPEVIVNEFMKVREQVTAGYKNIISSLWSSIGDLTVPVIEAIDDVDSTIYQTMKDYQTAQAKGSDDRDIDYEAVVEKIQNLANTVSQISDIALSGSDIDDDVRDSVYVVALIFHHFLIMSHGTAVSVVASLNKPSGKIPFNSLMCLQTVDRLLVGMTAALNTETNSLGEGITLLLSSVVNLTSSLNDVLREVFGFVQNVAINVTPITETKTVVDVASGTSSGSEIS